MSNEIVKTSQLAFPEIMSIGKAFAESGMFPDVKSAAQAVVKIQAGQEMGISPFAAMNGINIIMGKPTVGAGIIASKVKSSGKYNYKMVEHTDKICSIDFYEGGEKLGNSSFTIEDAKKANTKNLDKFPKNMLFARAMSNGQKWFCPDVFNSTVYTDEEMESVQQTEDVPHVELPPPVYPKETEKKSNGLAKHPEPIPDDEQVVIEQWLQKINESKTIEELKKVYAEGKAIINSTPSLFTAKEDKKKSFLEPAK